jgi:hypothetical protein
MTTRESGMRSLKKGEADRSLASLFRVMAGTGELV